MKLSQTMILINLFFAYLYVPTSSSLSFKQSQHNPKSPSKPANLKILKISSYEVTFSWLPSNDIISPDYYVVTYKSKFEDTKDVQTTFTNITLYNLQPLTTYLISVSAGWAVEGDELKSDDLFTEITTHSDKPMVPVNFRVARVTDTVVQLAWSQPKGEIAVHHYILLKISNVGLKSETIIEKTTFMTKYNFTGLNSNEKYKFGLVAANLGQGDQISSDEIFLEVITLEEEPVVKRLTKYSDSGNVILTNVGLPLLAFALMIWHNQSYRSNRL